MVLEGLLASVKVRQLLTIPGYEELDYPLVARDLPLDPDVRDLAERMNELCEGSWVQAIERTLLHLLRRAETLELVENRPERAALLRAVVDRYSGFKDMIQEDAARASEPAPVLAGNA
jgi:hypothetical protein